MLITVQKVFGKRSVVLRLSQKLSNFPAVETIRPTFPASQFSRVRHKNTRSNPSLKPTLYSRRVTCTDSPETRADGKPWNWFWNISRSNEIIEGVGGENTKKSLALTVVACILYNLINTRQEREGLKSDSAAKLANRFQRLSWDYTVYHSRFFGHTIHTEMNSNIKEKENSTCWEMKKKIIQKKQR